MRRGAFLVLGGVVLAPYFVLAVGFWQMFVDPDTPIAPVVALGLVTVAIGTVPPFLPAMRGLEIVAARSLLDVPLAEPEPNPPWEARWRAACWYAVHLASGGVVITAIIFLMPVAVALITYGLAGYDGWIIFASPPPLDRLSGAGAVAVGVAILPLLAYLVAGVGRGLIALAPVLLGASSVERIRALETEAQRLTERNRLARELHDSVGHALTVTTMQAAAAQQVLDSDPEFARRAMLAIEKAGRAAMDDLDHVIGLLREDEPGGPSRSVEVALTGTVPQRGLADVARLVDEMRAAGLDVDADISVETPGLPAVTSREAYRVVQEGLTNALRHAGQVPVALRLRADDAGIGIELTNPVDPAAAARPAQDGRSGGGRGLPGMRERVNVLGGTFSAGPVGDSWLVRAHLPSTGH